MRRLLLRLSLFVPFLVLMVAINRWVDPARLFGRNKTLVIDGYEGKILEDLLAGRPHALRREYNIAAVTQDLIRHQKEIDVLVLGSSICTPFNSANFPGQTMVNGAVPGGDLEEAMCIYQLACEAGRRPKRVLLEVHGWGSMLGRRMSVLLRNFHPILLRVLRNLNDNGRQGRPRTGKDGRREVVDTGPWETGWFDPYDKLISPRYLQLALKTLYRRSSAWNAQSDAKSSDANFNILFPDGSTQWSAAMRSATPASVHQRFAHRAIQLVETEPLEMDAARRRAFEAFVDWATRSGTQVDLVFTPPLGWMYASIEAEYKALGRETPVQKTDRFLREFAAGHHLRIFGSFDQRQTTLTDADYVDQMHIRREAIGKLLVTPDVGVLRRRTLTSSRDTKAAGEQRTKRSPP